MDTTHKKPLIRIFHVMARSGGTIVSRCIGSMQNIVLLSEIHPAGLQYFNPLEQAIRWYNLITIEDITQYKRKGLTGFHDAITLIDQACSKAGKTLVIRDWSHLDYCGFPFTNPSYKTSIIKVLSNHFTINNFSMVRHPVSQWVSLSRLDAMQGKLDLDQFLHGYNVFAKHAKNTGFIRFEDFTTEPDRQLSIICKNLQIKYDPSYKNRWYLNEKVTGDQTGQGAIYSTIKPAALPNIKNESLKDFSENNDYKEAINILGYKHPN